MRHDHDPDYDPTPRVAGPRRQHSWEIHEQRLEDERKQLLSVLAQIAASTGGTFSALTNPPENDVLFAGVVLLGATGVWEDEWKQPCASVFAMDLNSMGPYLVTQQAPPDGSASPRQGAGSFQVLQNVAMTFPMRSNSIAIVGPAGGMLNVAVFARPQTAFAAVMP